MVISWPLLLRLVFPQAPVGHDRLVCYQGVCQTYLALGSSLPVSPHENCQLTTMGVAPHVIAAKR